MNGVRVPLATMWSDPDARTSDRVVTQLLLGDPVVVDEVRGDGWARVVATGQPAPALDPRGYPGWLRREELASTPDGPASTSDDPAESVVDALATDLRDGPAGNVVVAGVALGTPLVPAGPPIGSWLPVRVAGRPDPLWAPVGDVAPAPEPPPSAADALEVARRLLGVPYVWGGLSPAGIDCSGLVHLAWRRLGVLLPRDAHEQAAAVEPVPLGAERPGDLYFFARPGRRIHHVGIVAAAPERPGEPARMLHACGDARRVVEEPPAPDRVETLSGAGRVPGAH